MDVLQLRISCAILSFPIGARPVSLEEYIFYSREPCRRGLRESSRSLAEATWRRHHNVLCIVNNSRVMEVID